MAEGDIIPGADASKILAAAKAERARATEAAAVAGAGAKKVKAIVGQTEEALARIESRAARIVRTLKVEPTASGQRWRVSEPARGRGQTTTSYPTREGQTRPGAYATRERAEAEAMTIARERAHEEARLAQDTATVVEHAEKRKTKARARPASEPAAVRADAQEASSAEKTADRVVAAEQKKTTARRRSAKVAKEGSAIGGDAAEYNRRLDANAGRMLGGLPPAAGATPRARLEASIGKLAAGPEPTIDAERARQARIDEQTQRKDARNRESEESSRNAAALRVSRREAERSAAEAEQAAARRAEQEAARTRAQEAETEAARRRSPLLEQQRPLWMHPATGQLASAQAALPSRPLWMHPATGQLASAQAALPSGVDFTGGSARRALTLEEVQRRGGERSGAGIAPLPFARAPGTPSVAAAGGARRAAPALAAPTAADAAALKLAEAQAKRAAAQADRAAAAHAANLETVAAGEHAYAGALGESEAGMRRWSAQMGVVDQGMRRHGTFTTEFISAAAKGEVAYREWGWQIGAAATKFAAWTAAGAGIYAAIGLVSKVGEGAMASASGVDQLKRTIDNVDAGKAQQGFRSTAAKFNVPISDVVDAQGAMGAVFHNQDEALTAATAALYAYRTGQVSVADATKDLIAIQQGFGSSGADLIDLFDDLNYVQNRFGARIQDVLPGIASAAGSLKQLGASEAETIAMFATFSRYGTSGNIASTMVRRSGNQLRAPENQATLKQYGIDPKSDYDTIIKKARAAAKAGGDVLGISTAIFGKQYAGRGIALLTDTGVHDATLKAKREGKTSGASATELGHVLSQFNERLKAIGTELGNLGSNLGESGLVQVFGAFVVALTQSLKLTNSLLGALNEIPKPIKVAAAAALSFYAALGAARRLGLGGALEGKAGLRGAAAPYLIESDGRRRRRLIGAGLDRAVEASADEAETHTNASRRAFGDYNRAERNRVEVLAQTRGEVAAGRMTPEDAAKRQAYATEAVTKSELRARDAAVRGTRALEQADEQYALRARYDTLMTTTARRDRNDVARRFAAEEGMYIRPSLGADVPAAERVRLMTMMGVSGPGGTPAGEQSGSVIVPPARGERLKAEKAAEFATAEERVAAAALLGQSDQAKRMLPALKAQWQAAYAAKQASGVVAGGAAAASVALKGAKVGMTAGALALKGMGTALLGIMGPIGWLIAALSFAPAAYSAYKGLLKRQAQAQELPDELPDSKARLDNFVKQRQKQTDANNTIWGRIKGLPGGLTLHGLTHPFENNREQENAGLRAQDANARAQYAQIRKGLPAARLSGRAIIEQVGREISDSRSSHAELEKRRQRALAEVDLAGKDGKGATAGRAKQLKAQINAMFDAAEMAAADAVNESLYDLRRSQTDDPVAIANLNVQEAAEKYRIAAGGNQKAVDAAAKAVDVATASGDAAAIEAATKALEAAEAGGDQDSINKALAELNNAKREAIKTVAEQAAAMTDALGALVSAGLGGAGTLTKYIASLRAEIGKVAGSSKPEDIQRYAQLQGELKSAVSDAGKTQLETALANARGPGDVARAYRSYRRAGTRAADAAAGPPEPAVVGAGGLGGGLLGALAQAFGAQGADPRKPRRSAESKAALRLRNREIFEAEKARRDAQEAYTEGGLQQGMPRAKAALAYASEMVKKGIRIYAKGSVELLGLMSAQQSAQDAVASEQLAMIDANAAYAAAGTTDPVAKLQAGLHGSYQHLASLRANKGSADAIRTTEAEILDKRAEIADTIRQQAADLLDSQYAVKASLNDDPVYQARLEAQRTAQVLTRGGFKTKAEENNAIAERNNALRSAQDTALQAKMEDIQHSVDIGKTTVAQEIAAYQHLLKTAKMGTQAKKHLKQEIETLQHDAETADVGQFELGLGNIKIPTMYEVARLVKGGAGSVTQGVTNANTVNITVNGPQDYGELGRVLDAHVNGAGKATARAAQMR